MSQAVHAYTTPALRLASVNPCPRPASAGAVPPPPNFFDPDSDILSDLVTAAAAANQKAHDEGISFGEAFERVLRHILCYNGEREYLPWK